MTGQRFNRWTVLRRNGTSKSGAAIWMCECDCGTIKNIVSTSLKNQTSKSCGCLNKEIVSQLHKHRLKKHNLYDLSGEYGIGFTDDGQKFLFDKSDFEKIKPYYWTFNQSGYVVSVSVIPEKRIRLSRLVMDCLNEECLVDHIGHRLYDNRKKFLRKVNSSQNTMNGILRNNNHSGITGVCWDKARSKWMVTIMVNSKSIYLGRYDNIQDAISARKQAEDKYFGEYSYDNSQRIISEKGV